MQKLFVALLLLLSPLDCFAQYRLAIGAIFRNEAPWLKEWIEYHRLIGVEHFYLYNNESSDNYLQVLDPYIASGVVELTDWPSIPANIDYRFNPTTPEGTIVKAYNDMVRRAFRKADWLAIVDIDEFIMPLQGISRFFAFLDNLPHKVGALSVYWHIFGTSNTWSLSEGDLMVEKLHLCTEKSHEWNRIPKTFYRLKALPSLPDCWVHNPVSLPNRYIQIEMPRDLCRINHYWTRTEEACLRKRLGAYSYEELSDASRREFDKYNTTLNAVKDTSMQPYIPLLKARLQAQTNHAQEM
ncbi:MAG: glycosyltransferase family 92 protein [Chlamydiales bacterium]|nr:glycosyltransferase family 92 protein [Chlamydiales bacterium]